MRYAQTRQGDFIEMIKRFFAFFTALAISLTSSGIWSTRVYAATVYTQNISNPSVSSNQTVTSSFIRNYTKGISIYASSPLTFKNDGAVNVSGGSFQMTNTVTFENNGTFTFTGDSDTFSLGNQGSFVNNGTAAIKGVYNFGAQNGTSFINNGTLYLEDISNTNLTGFVNNGVIIIPDDAKNSKLHLALEGKNGENGRIYTQTDFENRKLRYPINYEGLSADGYYDYNNPNPADYEWAAADPQNVTLADPTLGGYEFLGWTGLDITEPTKSFTFSSAVCQEVTVTANWKPIVYTITYELDGGSFSDTQTPPEEYTRGDQNGIPSPSKTGYTFNGWIDTDSGEPVSTASDRFYYMPPSTLGDKTYKASFIANSDTQYKVLCYYRNIDGTYAEKAYLLTGETGAQVSVSSEDYDKEGFSFDKDHSDSVLSGAIRADNSLELKLYFNRNQYTVTFKSQDGGETLWTTTKYYDEKVGEYGGEIPSKVSDNDLYTYVFDNWAREEPNRDFGYAVNDVVVSEEITFYAAFKSVRDESAVVIKWVEYDGFNAPAQTEIRLGKGADYTADLWLKDKKYCVGTREWTLGFQEAHIYWYDVETGEHGVDYSIDKESYEAPVVLKIPNVQHDVIIKVKARYHEEHDFSEADDTIVQNGNCVTDSVIRHFCYKCGYTEDETVSTDRHKPGSTFEKDEVSHWKVCGICKGKLEMTVHTPDAGVITHEPTHNSTGTKTYTCTVCGYVTGRETLEMIPHAPEGDWQHNAKTHYKTCSCGAILEETPHTPDTGTMILEPTYNIEGKTEYRCTVCGYLIGEVSIAPLGHNVDDEWQSELSGHWRECECGEKHNFGEHISNGGLVTIKPTYNSWGERVFSCTVCGYVLRTETIHPLDGGPDVPSKPVVPSKPSNTFEPSEPSDPSEPFEPTEPVIPDKPVTPSLPENGIPFIKDDCGKNGWDTIKAEAEKAAEGSTVTVDMNGTTVVPGTVIDSITGRNVTFVFDMEDGITWSVNGKSVPSRNNKDIDFSVKKNTGAIPVDVVNLLTGERRSIQISLAHSGEFGFTAVLSINLGSENAGLRAALYFYNDGAPELIDESKIAQDGTARLTFKHASDYLIVIGEKTDNDSEKTNDSNGESNNRIETSEVDDKITPPSKPDESNVNDGNPETGVAGQPWRITLIGAMAAIVGALSLRRKKSETK